MGWDVVDEGAARPDGVLVEEVADDGDEVLEVDGLFVEGSNVVGDGRGICRLVPVALVSVDFERGLGVVE